MKKPKIPIKNIIKFFTKIHVQLPAPVMIKMLLNVNTFYSNILFCSSQSVSTCIIGGKIRARQLLERAPTSDIKRSRRGMEAASPTKI